MTAAATAPGLTLAALAERLRVSEQEARELLRPFLQHGLVAERAGRLTVADRAVLAAFYRPEEEAGGAG